jgi:BMFP domain-containing protein YqiC
MPAKDSPLEDLLKLAEQTFDILLDSRNEISAKARAKCEHITRRLGFVSRNEFDAAFAMLAKARATQEELNERLKAVEAKLKMSRAQAKKPATKLILRTVKHKRAKARRA